MEVIGIDLTSQMEILRTIAAIMHIGNITFIENKNFAAIADEQCNFKHCFVELVSATSQRLLRHRFHRFMNWSVHPLVCILARNRFTALKHLWREGFLGQCGLILSIFWIWPLIVLCFLSCYKFRPTSCLVLSPAVKKYRSLSFEHSFPIER